RGGQNILDPAAAGKAVLFGPHLENFSAAVRLLLGRGGIQVSSPAQLEEVLVDLLARPQYRRELGDLGRTQVFSMQGTAARNAALIATLLPAAQRQATT
ncbi:MAG: 3-deoxy-D-manno-octulosonic acid transferase, partial [Myxococcota bacterium]